MTDNIESDPGNVTQLTKASAITLLVLATSIFVFCWSFDTSPNPTDHRVTDTRALPDSRLRNSELGREPKLPRPKTKLKEALTPNETSKTTRDLPKEDSKMLWTVTSAISSAVAALATLFTLFHAISIWKQQTRPYVIVDLEASEQNIEFVVKNVGKSVASDVSVIVSPAILDIKGRNVLNTLFQMPLAFLAPEKEMRTFVNKSYNFLADEQPLSYTFDVTYSSADGKDDYTESHVVSLLFLRHTVIVGTKTHKQARETFA